MDHHLHTRDEFGITLLPRVLLFEFSDELFVCCASRPDRHLERSRMANDPGEKLEWDILGNSILNRFRDTEDSQSLCDSEKNVRVCQSTPRTSSTTKPEYKHVRIALWEFAIRGGQKALRVEGHWVSIDGWIVGKCPRILKAVSGTTVSWNG